MDLWILLIIFNEVVCSSFNTNWTQNWLPESLLNTNVLINTLWNRTSNRTKLFESWKKATIRTDFSLMANLHPPSSSTFQKHGCECFVSIMNYYKPSNSTHSHSHTFRTRSSLSYRGAHKNHFPISFHKVGVYCVKKPEFMS